jgi:hypothetical protein
MIIYFSYSFITPSQLLDLYLEKMYSEENIYIY